MAIHCDIQKNFGKFHLNVRLDASNEVLGILGASGCGKSMTLKCIAGVVKPDSGRIVLDNKVLYDSRKRINLAPQARRVGFLFQNYALFPQMTVHDNILIGARRERDRRLRTQQVAELMARFEIDHLANHYPAQLSGGQQQRTALARILVSEPEILLLDEPFSALDSHLRFRLERELGEVARRFGKTVLLVSHDRNEIFRLADKIAIMNHGQVEVCGDKSNIFHNPSTKEGAILTGCKNLSSFSPLEGQRGYAEDWGLTLTTARDPGGYDVVGIHMHDLQYGDGPNAHAFTVLEEIENPFSVTVMVQADNMPKAAPLGWEADKALWKMVRAPRITLHLPPEKVMLLQAHEKLSR